MKNILCLFLIIFSINSFAYLPITCNDVLPTLNSTLFKMITNICNYDIMNKMNFILSPKSVTTNKDIRDGHFSIINQTTGNVLMPYDEFKHFFIKKSSNDLLLVESSSLQEVTNYDWLKQVYELPTDLVSTSINAINYYFSGMNDADDSCDNCSSSKFNTAGYIAIGAFATTTLLLASWVIYNKKCEKNKYNRVR